MRKGEKLSDEHKAKMCAGRAKKRLASIKTPAPATEIIASQVPNAPVNPSTVEKAVLENPEDKPVAEPKGVRSSGETKKMDFQNFVANENTGPSTAITTQLPGQKELIKKVLSKKVPKLSTPLKNPTDDTTKNLKTNDPKAIEAKAPFSFNALRLRLRT